MKKAPENPFPMLFLKALNYLLRIDYSITVFGMQPVL